MTIQYDMTASSGGIIILHLQILKSKYKCKISEGGPNRGNKEQISKHKIICRMQIPSEKYKSRKLKYKNTKYK